MKTQDNNKFRSINYSSIDIERNRLNNSNMSKRVIIQFVLNNLAGYENHTFFEELDKLEKL